MAQAAPLGAPTWRSSATASRIAAAISPFGARAIGRSPAGVTIVT